MKFDYCAEILSENYFPAYHFKYTLTEDEVRKFLHKYGYDDINNFMSVFSNATVDDFYKILSSVEIIRDSLSSDKVDLGIDYKKKYEELVELLEPHKIDDMPPETTLKMILQYGKP
jgi:hypothetical protein